MYLITCNTVQFYKKNPISPFYYYGHRKEHSQHKLQGVDRRKLSKTSTN